MFEEVMWILFLIFGHEVITGNTISDIGKCESKAVGGSEVFVSQYCLVTKGDVELSCPKKKIVVVSSLRLAIKSGSCCEVCTSRVIDTANRFCCTRQDNDVLYNGDCLQTVWNNEDQVYFWEFITKSLKVCRNTSNCVLNSRMFTNLQRKIPGAKMYSSYFQILHQCITAPVNPLNLCSSRSKTGKYIHIQGYLSSAEYTNRTCTCQVTSQTDSDVIAKAVDVTNIPGEIILKSEKETKLISSKSNPLYGFKNILSGKKLSISLNKPAESSDSGNFWLVISDSEGKNVNVACGENTGTVESTTTSHGRVSNVLPETDIAVFWGYWPLVYIASGSLFTIVIVACILCGVLFCRNGKKKRRRENEPCGFPTLTSPACYYHDPSGHPYATVLDDTPSIPDPRGKTTSQPRSSPNPTSPSVATFPGNLSYDSNAPYMHTMPPGASNDVSQLEAFLQ